MKKSLFNPYQASTSKLNMIIFNLRSANGSLWGSGIRGDFLDYLHSKLRLFTF